MILRPIVPTKSGDTPNPEIEMRNARSFGPNLGLFAPPYNNISQIPVGWMPEMLPPRGIAIVWSLWDAMHQAQEFEYLLERPHGVPVIIILPNVTEISRTLPLINRVMALDPRAVLPSGIMSTPHEIRQVLSLPPQQLSTTLTRYLRRRGLLLNGRIAMVVEKIMRCSSEVKSITKLASRLYTSRRTLGRRFEAEGLPVPSHWLQFSRIAHVALRIQHEGTAIFRIACDSKYPDGFTMSNQMKRLIGCRPTEVRRHLGWEWIVESWIAQEVALGGFDHCRYGDAISPYLNHRKKGGAGE